MSKQVLILGNGISRKKVKNQIKDWKFDLWGCNWAFKESIQYPIDRVYSVHPEVVEEAFKFRRNYKLSYSIFSTKTSTLADGFFKKSLGWSTGNLALIDALEEGYDKILVAGFDFGGSDIYQPHQIPGGNFFKQFTDILKNYGEERIFFLRENGVLSVSQMRQLKINSFWATMEKKKPNSNKRIPSFNPTQSQQNGRTLILGNSPCVLDYNYGSYIDTFNTVVRINDYILDGYSDKIGLKTDIWFTGASKVARKRSEEELGKTIPILGLSSSRLHMNENDHIRGRLYKDLAETFDISPNKYTAIPFIVAEKIKRELGIIAPTTGFLALYYFVEYLKFRNVTIHGFDFFENKYHYYDKDKKMNTKLSVSHHYDKEKEIVKKWLSKGKISLLTDHASPSMSSTVFKNILVFGNSTDIIDIPFEKIKELQEKKDFITVGINRIFKLFQPDILFFIDGPILKSLCELDIQRQEHSTWIISDHVFNNKEHQLNREDFQSYIDEQEIIVLDIDFYSEICRKSSVLWLLHYLHAYLYKNFVCKFYLKGVSLISKIQGNYFDGSNNDFYSYTTLQNQYDSQFQGICKLYESGYLLYSMTKESKLNSVLPYIQQDIVQFLEEKMPNKLKQAVVSLMTPEFLVAYPVFIKSLLKFNEWFNLDIILLTLGLSDEQKQFCLEQYPNTKFRQIQEEKYEKIDFNTTRNNLKNTYYKLDVFSIQDYDLLAFIDLDVVFQGNIVDLFYKTEGIHLAQAYTASSDFIREDEFNSGVIVITKEYLNEETYRGLLEEAEKGFSLPDQFVINNYFKGKIKKLDKSFNCEKRLLKSKQFSQLLFTAKIIHFVSQKPWDINKTSLNEGFEKLENIWWEFVEDKEEYMKRIPL